MNNRLIDKNRTELKIADEKESYIRSQEWKRLVHRISKYGVVGVITLACIWFGLMFFHNLGVIKWDANWGWIDSWGEKLVFGVMGYFVGLINKRLFLDS